MTDPQIAQAPDQLRALLQRIMLAVLVIDAVQVIALTARGQLLGRPNGPGYTVLAIAAIGAYLVAVTALTRVTPPWLGLLRRIALRFGLITGAMWATSLIVETYAGLSGWPSIAATGPLLIGGFVLFGVSGAVGYGRTGNKRVGVLTATATSLICVTATITIGLTQTWFALDTLARNLDGSPEYLASGWHDLPAFAIANTLDAAATHTLLAPTIAAIAAALAIAITAAYHRRDGRVRGDGPGA
jgi:hypothetical protein